MYAELTFSQSLRYALRLRRNQTATVLPHRDCGHTSGTDVANHVTSAAFTSAGVSCASQ
jgi:hypothetical protein